MGHTRHWTGRNEHTLYNQPQCYRREAIASLLGANMGGRDECGVTRCFQDGPTISDPNHESEFLQWVIVDAEMIAADRTRGCLLSSGVWSGSHRRTVRRANLRRGRYWPSAVKL